MLSSSVAFESFSAIVVIVLLLKVVDALKYIAVCSNCRLGV